MTELLEIFKKTWEDKVFSRSEKQAIKQLVDENSLEKRKLDWLRSQVFDFAKSISSEYNHHAVIDWLEIANKALLPSIEAAPVETSRVCFSPGYECREAVCNFVKSAQKTLDICVFTITDNDIRDEIIKAHKNGVKVRIISDDEKSWDQGSDIDYLRDRGIPVHLDHSPAHMHHKFAVSDKKSLLNGSFNWTISASSSNQENVVITSEIALVKQFQGRFEMLWSSTAV